MARLNSWKTDGLKHRIVIEGDNFDLSIARIATNGLSIIMWGRPRNYSIEIRRNEAEELRDKLSKWLDDATIE